MNSFDVFDTLLARRYVNNDAILQQLETDFSIPNFAQARKAADTGLRSLKQIYEALVNLNVISTDQIGQIMDREIELEIKTAFPIRQNINRVNDGDILISDMYLPAHAILQMVRAVGMDKQVTIYQSNQGKSSGALWDAVKANPPALHLGDNKHSDYDMPMSKGVKAEHFNVVQFNELEQFLANNQLSHLALLLREIRLSSVKTSCDEVFGFANINLAWLFMTSEILHRKYKDRDIIFLGRDCQLMHKVHSAYYKESSYLPFSRQVAYTQPEESIEYLRSHSSDNAMFVDIVSTGGTWELLNKHDKIDITILIYSDIGCNSKVKPVLPESFSYVTTHSELNQATNILYPELFNCGDHGHLDSLTKVCDGVFAANFAQLDLPMDIVTVVHSPAKEAVALSRYYQGNVRTDLSKLTDTQLKQIFNTLLQAIGSKHELRQLVPEFFNKEDAHLAAIKQVMNK